ncbi:MAG: hypothetical protein LAO08_00975 [Acidobacteriia bacterium]|nr:hypothetical protein [Terriglobia bacterium]
MTSTISNRRRSQRLFIQIAVQVQGRLANKSEFSENAHTVVVNAHGALVELGIPLDQGQRVILHNIRTSEKIASEVKLVTPGESGKFNVALEFVDPNPGFWHISFPPEDWSAQRLSPAKKA